MFIATGIIACALLAGIDAFINRKYTSRKWLSVFLIDFIVFLVFSTLSGELLLRLIGASLMPVSSHSFRFALIYFVWAFLSSLVPLYYLWMINKELTVKTPLKKKHIALNILILVVLLFGVAAGTGTMWSLRNFGSVIPDQLFINMVSPTDGTSDEIMRTLFLGPVLYTCLTGVLFGLFLFSQNKQITLTETIKNPARKFANALLSIRFRRIVCALLALAVFFSGVVYGVKQFRLIDLWPMFVNRTSFVEDHYRDPKTVSMSFPKQKRNLIHLYLESMEVSYASKELGGYMDENLIKPLTDLAKEPGAYSFSNRNGKFGGAVSTTGCVWSAASMINQTTGLPFKFDLNLRSNEEDNFLSGTTALGDILDAEGYEQSLMLGSSARFAGLDYYYRQHGNFNILDYKYAKENGWIPQDYRVWWGFEDDKLYEFAKKEITRLANTGKPFNFTMENADTHFPDGYVGANTPRTRNSQYADVIAYSASEVVKFVRWIQAQPFYENTTLVLIGDHNSMDTTFFKGFDSGYLRTTYNCIINPAPTAVSTGTKLYDRWFCNVDLFPTIMASLGVRIDGDRLGLGTNLFSNQPTLFEQNGGEAGWHMIDKEFINGSNYYNDVLLGTDNHIFTQTNVTEY